MRLRADALHHRAYSWLQITFSDKLQERSVLIRNAHNAHAFTRAAFGQRLATRLGDISSRVRNWVAMRIGQRPAKKFIKAIQNARGLGVLKTLGLLMHIGPI